MHLQELARLPDNDVTAEYVDAMAAAVQEYGNPQAIVLFVVQPSEKNSYDQQVGNAHQLHIACNGQGIMTTIV